MCGLKTAHKNTKIMLTRDIKPTLITTDELEKGESIEEMLRRIIANGEPIPENVQPIFTPAENGVMPEYDIRTDRQELALDAIDKYEASKIASSAAAPVETTETKTQEEETPQTSE